MPAPIEYIDTSSIVSSGYTIDVPFNMWLRGEEATKVGFMYISNPVKYDILGFILKRAGYNNKDLTGIRVPSELAQIKHRSGITLSSVASFLTSPGHADSDLCIELGMINDNPMIDDAVRQDKISKILLTTGLGVRFSEKMFVPLSGMEAYHLLENMLAKSKAELGSDSNIVEQVIKPLRNSKLCIAFCIVADQIVYMLYNPLAYISEGIISSGVVSSTSHLMKTIIKLAPDFMQNASTWFSVEVNRTKLSSECYYFLTENMPIF